MSGLISYGPYVKKPTIPEKTRNIKFAGELDKLPSDDPLIKVKGFFPALHSNIFVRKLQYNSEVLYIHYVFSYDLPSLDILHSEDIQEVFLEVPEYPRYRTIHKAFENIQELHANYTFECTHYLQLTFPSGPADVAVLCIFSWDSSNLTTTKLLGNLEFSSPTFLFQPFQFKNKTETQTDVQVLSPLPLLDLFLELQYILNMKQFFLKALESQEEGTNFIDTLVPLLEGSKTANGNPTYVSLEKGVEETEELQSLLTLIGELVVKEGENQYFNCTDDYWKSKYSFRDVLYFAYLSLHSFQTYRIRLLNASQYYNSPAIENTLYNNLFKKNREIFDKRGFVIVVDTMLKRLPESIVTLLNNDSENKSLIKAANFLFDSILYKEVIVQEPGSKPQSMRLPFTMLQRGVLFVYTENIQHVYLDEYKSNFYKEWLEPISNQDWQIIIQATEPPQSIIQYKLTGEVFPSDAIIQNDKVISFEACHWLKDIFEVLYGNEYYATESIQTLSPDQLYFLNKGYLAKLQAQKCYINAEVYLLENSLRIPIEEVQSPYYIPLLKKELREEGSSKDSYAQFQKQLISESYAELKIRTDLSIDTPGYFVLPNRVTYTIDGKHYNQPIAGFLGPFFQGSGQFSLYSFMNVATPEGWSYTTFECLGVETSYLELLRYRDSWTPFFLNSFRIPEEKEKASDTIRRIYTFTEKDIATNTRGGTLLQKFYTDFINTLNPQEGLFEAIAASMQEKKNCTFFVLDMYAFEPPKIDRQRIVFTYDPSSDSWSNKIYLTQKKVGIADGGVAHLTENILIHMPLFSETFKDITLEDSTLLGSPKGSLELNGIYYLNRAILSQVILSKLRQEFKMSNDNILSQYETSNVLYKFLSGNCILPLQAISYPFLTAYTFAKPTERRYEHLYFFNIRSKGIHIDSIAGLFGELFTYKNTYYENQFNTSIAREWNYVCAVYTMYTTIVNKETYTSMLPKLAPKLEQVALGRNRSLRESLEIKILEELKETISFPNSLEKAEKNNLPKRFEAINLNATKKGADYTLDRKVFFFIRNLEKQINEMRAAKLQDTLLTATMLDSKAQMVVDAHWRKTWKDFTAVQRYAIQQVERTETEIQAELKRRKEAQEAEDKRRREEEEAERKRLEKVRREGVIGMKIDALVKHKQTAMGTNLNGYNAGKIATLIGSFKNSASTRQALVQKYSTTDLTPHLNAVEANLNANKKRFNAQLVKNKAAYKKEKNDIAAAFAAYKAQVRPLLMYTLYADKQLDYILDYERGSQRREQMKTLAPSDKSDATKKADAILAASVSIEDLQQKFNDIKESYRKRKIATYAAAKCDLYRRRENIPKYSSITDAIIQSADYSSYLKYTKIYKLYALPQAHSDLELGVDYVAKYYCNVDPSILSRKQNYERDQEEILRQAELRKQQEAREAEVQKTIAEMTPGQARGLLESRSRRRRGSRDNTDPRIYERAEELNAPRREEEEKQRRASTRYEPEYYYDPRTGKATAFGLREVTPSYNPPIMGFNDPRRRYNPPIAYPEVVEEAPKPGLGASLVSGLGSAASGLGSFVKGYLPGQQAEANVYPDYPSLASKTSGRSKGRAGSPGRGGKRKTLKRKAFKQLLKRRKSRGKK